MMTRKLHPSPRKIFTTCRRIKIEKENKSGMGVPPWDHSAQETDVRSRLAWGTQGDSV